MVTVIIPNYNHVKYLSKRIESVVNQSYKEIEIILMDDCSTDNSRAVISEYASKDDRIRVVLNEKNSGSTFKQWNKGISLAKGKYIWIAESDDYADSELLKTLLKIMEANPKVGLTYCDSFSVDENAIKLNVVKDVLNENLKTDLWNRDFVMDGRYFVKKYLSFSNSIPNASAIILRKDILNKIGPSDTSLRLAGDWMYWIKVLIASDIAYIHKPLNYFRTHTLNVRSQTLENGTFIVETSNVMSYIKSLFPDEVYDPTATKAFLRYWVYSYKMGYISFSKNILIAKNISKVMDGGAVLLMTFMKYISKHKFRGARQLLGLHK